MVENHGMGEQNMEIPKTKTKNVTKMNKCNQCVYASSLAGNLRTHMKKHTGEKCNHCDYVTSHAGSLKTYMKNTLEKSQTVRQGI